MNWKTLFIVKDVRFVTYSSYADWELVERKRVAPSVEEHRKKADFVVEIPTYELSVEMAAGKKIQGVIIHEWKVEVGRFYFKALQYRDAIGSSTNVIAQLTNESTVLSKEEFIKMLRDAG